MVFLIALGALAVFSLLLWAGTKGPLKRDVPVDSRRVTAACLGILAITIVGLFWVAIGGLAENPPTSRWPYPLEVPVVAAVVEYLWILITCGLGRRARAPLVCALISSGIWLIGALTR